MGNFFRNMYLLVTTLFFINIGFFYFDFTFFEMIIITYLVNILIILLNIYDKYIEELKNE